MHHLKIRNNISPAEEKEIKESEQHFMTGVPSGIPQEDTLDDLDDLDSDSIMKMNAITKNLQCLHDRKVVKPKHPGDPMVQEEQCKAHLYLELTREYRHKAFSYLISPKMKQHEALKQNIIIRSRGHTDAHEQRKWMSNDDNFSTERKKVHQCLGLIIDYSNSDEVKLTMIDCVGDLLDELPEDVRRQMAIPAAAHLFDMDEDNPIILFEEDAIPFHHTVAKLLSLSKRARPDIQLAVTVLCTRVREPDKPLFLIFPPSIIQSFRLFMSKSRLLMSVLLKLCLICCC